MKRFAIWLLALPVIGLLAFLLSRSGVPSSPVQASTLIGTWQRVDKPGISWILKEDGTFSAAAVGQRFAGGSYQLVNGTSIILSFDNSSPNPITVTNTVTMKGKELRMTLADGKSESFRRAE